MRYGLLALAIALVVGFSLAALPSPARAAGAGAVVGASQPVRLPRGLAAEAWAEHWQRQAERNLRRLNRIRACWRLDDLHLPALHTRDAYSLGRAYRRLARHYAGKHRSMHRRLIHPAGTGASRWRPLARHCGWPERQLDRLVTVIARESGGYPGARNGVFVGLLQIWQAHAPRVNLYQPESNLAVGLQLWRRSGWTPWAL